MKIWKAGFGTSYPQKKLDVIIDLSQQEKFFEQLTRFADAHAFAIHIGATTPAGDTFNMSRKDVMVIADNVFDTKRSMLIFTTKTRPTQCRKTLLTIYSTISRDISVKFRMR